MKQKLSNLDLQERIKNLESELSHSQKETAYLRSTLGAFIKGSQNVLKHQSFADTARSLFDLCKKQIGAQCGYVALLNEDGTENEILFLDSGGLPCDVDPALPMPIRGLRGEVYASSEPAYENDFEHSAWVKFMPKGHVRLKNAMFAPLVHDGKTMGVLGLANKPSDFDEKDAKIAAAFGKLAAIALRAAKHVGEVQKAESALRQSEKEFRSLLDTMNEGVCLHEIVYDQNRKPIDYQIRDVNPAYERITGITRDRARNQKASELYSTEEPPFLEVYARVAETGAPESFEIFWPPMKSHFLISVFSPQKGQFATVFTDITDQKNKEEQLRVSEEYLSTTLNSIGDAVIVTDTRGTITRMNPIAEKLTGRELSDALGKPLENVFNILNQKTREKVESPVSAVLRRGGIVGLYNDTVLISKDGKEYFIDDSGAPIRDSNGAVAGVVLIFRDITEKYTAEDALRHSEEKYKALYENAPLSYQSLDESGCFLDVNPAWLKNLGYEREGVIGKSFAEFLHPDWKPHFEKNFPEFKRRGYVSDVQFKIRHKQGHYLDISFEGCIGYWPDGSFRQTYCVFQDITERKRAEEALRESEEKYRLTYNSSPDAVNINRLRDGLYVDINEGFTQLTGFTREDVIGKTSSEINIWHDPSDRAKLVQGLQKNSYYDNLEARFKRKDGSLTTALMSARLLILNGEAHIISITRDISARKEAEAEHERLMSAIKQAIEMVVITDPEGTIQFVNPAFEHITGYKQHEAIGQNPRILKSGQHDEAFYKGLWNTIRAGNRWSGRLVNKRKDGSLYTAECSISPVMSSNGEVLNFVWISRDITKELELEKGMIQAQKMEAIGTLAGGIAHDFNNILGAITGFAEMAAMRLDPESPEKRYLEQVLRGGDRAKDLVKQILAFSRQAEEEKRPVNVSHILKEVLKFLRATLPTTITIDSHIDRDSGIVLADPVQFHQIIMNLCSNAGYAMRARGGLLHVDLHNIELDAERAKNVDPDLSTGSYIHLMVSDTGEGIDRTTLDKIFNPFFTTKGKGEGTGLGLSVVHGIVKSLGGAITVESERGSGATFQVFLPRLEAPCEQKPEQNEPLPTGDGRVLFVDDEEVLTQVARHMLERLGYEVVTATNSKQAVDLFFLEPERFDMVITDLTMPKITGIELTKTILAIRPDIPVLLCTGYLNEDTERQARQAGIREIVMKPMKMGDLGATIQKVLNKDRIIVEK